MGHVQSLCFVKGKRETEPEVIGGWKSSGRALSSFFLAAHRAGALAAGRPCCRPHSATFPTVFLTDEEVNTREAIATPALLAEVAESKLSQFPAATLVPDNRAGGVRSKRIRWRTI